MKVCGSLLLIRLLNTFFSLYLKVPAHYEKKYENMFSSASEEASLPSPDLPVSFASPAGLTKTLLSFLLTNGMW